MPDDLSNKVMERVVGLEKRRVFWWRTVFGLIAGGLITVALILLWQSWQVVQNQGTLDLLTLFQEDFEIIAEFWQDTLATFIEELPQQRLILTILVGGIIALVFLVTQKTRRIIKKKSETFSKFKAY